MASSRGSLENDHDRLHALRPSCFIVSCTTDPRRLPPERHHRPDRRSGLRRLLVPRQSGPQDAEPRQAARRERSPDRFPRLPDVYADTRATYDGHGCACATAPRPCARADRSCGRGIPTMPQVFRAPTATAPAIFGKWHLGDSYPNLPHQRGFQEAVYHLGWGITSMADTWQNDYFDGRFSTTASCSSTTATAPTSGSTWRMAWMKERAAKNEPFFLYLPTNAPHGPHWVPAKYKQPYQGKGPARVLRHDRQPRREHRPARQVPRRERICGQHDRHLLERQRRHRRRQDLQRRHARPARRRTTRAAIAPRASSAGRPASSASRATSTS